jgi:hypothetical protein
MKPVKFKGSNVVFAENQPEYLPLPAYRSVNGVVVSCWQMGWKERFKLLVSGRVWLRLLTFNNPIQPQRLYVDCPLNTRSEV